MKRDMDLIREILLECEKQDGTGRPIKVAIEGRSGDEVNYHLVLLKEVGFIEASSVLKTRFGPVLQPIRLTWSGHEFLGAARSSKAVGRGEGIFVEDHWSNHARSVETGDPARHENTDGALTVLRAVTKRSALFTSARSEPCFDILPPISNRCADLQVLGAAAEQSPTAHTGNAHLEKLGDLMLVHQFRRSVDWRLCRGRGDRA